MAGGRGRSPDVLNGHPDLGPRPGRAGRRCARVPCGDLPRRLFRQSFPDAGEACDLSHTSVFIWAFVRPVGPCPHPGRLVNSPVGACRTWGRGVCTGGAGPGRTMAVRCEGGPAGDRDRGRSVYRSGRWLHSWVRWLAPPPSPGRRWWKTASGTGIPGVKARRAMFLPRPVRCRVRQLLEAGKEGNELPAKFPADVNRGSRVAGGKGPDLGEPAGRSMAHLVTMRIFKREAPWHGSRAMCGRNTALEFDAAAGAAEAAALPAHRPGSLLPMPPRGLEGAAAGRRRVIDLSPSRRQEVAKKQR
ncbi:hypothetical protein ACRB68_19090 [Actinomadura sp. RB68]|uniref:Uncharacterized protein n=1 Tax=Actinomadura macrotermitis TaxID=2585200 RepID=A0A7K0BRN6_9ACTN|nr:hypothetical protein [Actinomadura macrotermitis]